MVFECNFLECNSKCCRNIKQGFFVNYDIDSKRFIHFLVNPNNSGIALFYEEKNELLRLAKNLGINISVKPFRAFLSKCRKVVVFKWFLDHDDCPFLKDNKCLIYDNRPLICRTFPLLPPFSCQPLPENPIISSYCPSAKKCRDYHDLEEYYKKFVGKQESIINEINRRIDNKEIIKEKTSTVMRLAGFEENMEELKNK